MTDHRLELGGQTRRAVLGDAYVERAAARAVPFLADFQELATRYAWGEIWARPGLDRPIRSCVTVAVLAAHGHIDELAIHLRAALRAELTAEQLKEVLLQVGLYSGLPAAATALGVLHRVLTEQAEDQLSGKDPS
jgi:3-oxoadipate enol-lactonase/4-carboxymuconolactone decarboxylase